MSKPPHQNQRSNFSGGGGRGNGRPSTSENRGASSSSSGYSRGGGSNSGTGYRDNSRNSIYGQQQDTSYNRRESSGPGNYRGNAYQQRRPSNTSGYYPRKESTITDPIYRDISYAHKKTPDEHQSRILPQQSQIRKTMDYSSFKTHTLNSVKAKSKRPDKGGDLGDRVKVFTNYYDIEVDLTKTILHYDIEITKKNRDRSTSQNNQSATNTQAVQPDNDSDKPMIIKKATKTKILEKLFTEKQIQLYVYDGEKNVYTTQEISQGEFTASLQNSNNNRESSFTVKIKFARNIDLKQMGDYLNGVYNEPYPMLEANLLGLIIRQKKLETTQLEKNSVFDISKKNSLENGLDFVFGNYSTVKLCQFGCMQNSDLDTAVFYSPCLMHEFVTQLIPRFNIETEMLSSSDIKQILKEIKSIFIEIKHLPGRKFKVVDLAKPADEETFDFNGKRITVKDYHEQRNNHKLMYPHLNCVKVDKNICFPMEICRIVDGQRYKKTLDPRVQSILVRATAIKPNQRAEQINQMMVSVDKSRPLKEHFGIRKLDTQMVVCDARVLPPTTIHYAPKPREAALSNVTCQNGEWLVHKFCRNMVLENWTIVYLATRTRLFLYDKENNIRNGPNVIGNYRTEDLDCLFSSDAFKAKQLVVFVLDDDYQYKKIKTLAERIHGVLTQCINYKKLASNMTEIGKAIAYLSNLSLKVNAKLGGVNNMVDIRLGTDKNKGTMVFGADVTHNVRLDDDGSSTNSQKEKKLSIAAVVGSLDSNFTKYAARIKEQIMDEKRDSREIIDKLEEITVDLIGSYLKENGQVAPSSIIFYRDGVDEGQFDAVMMVELKALQAACKKFNPDIRITYVVVQKRHHTRFFKIDPARKGGISDHNIEPGTVIDTGVVNMYDFDFYLCSHKSGQGTAKPTHYWVIHDENLFTSNQIQLFTYKMCHLYVKATKSVSIPAPVYYAHLAAFRGRNYKLYDPTEEIDIHPDVMEKMFFA